MIRRKLTGMIRKRLDEYPAVALLGPRQCGKTTLARALGGKYFDLEQPGDRLRMDIDWSSLAGASGRVILDEAQEMPEVFPRLRAAIDQDRKRNGRFLLLGSVSPSRMSKVSESLAGRLALCELSPFVAAERPENEWDHLWRTGGYPDGGVLDKSRYPGWQQFYLQMLAQRDLPHWGLPAQPEQTLRLFKMLAALHGQKWNASEIGKSLGLSYHTVNKYADFLEQAFLIRRLPAYSANIRKRLVKNPKIYWRDTGLLHALLGMDSEGDLFAKPWVGASWEGWIIEQIINHLHLEGISHEAWFLRTSDQQEIDLLLRARNRLWAVEIKLSSSPSISDMEKLTAIGKLVDADYSLLISRTPKSVQGKTSASMDLKGALKLLTGK